MPATDLPRIARTLHEVPFPRKLALELTAECNLRCSMCHHPAMRRPKGVMPMALWERLASEVARHAPATEVWFSFCGEPLLEADLLCAMIRHGASAGLKSININTNGMLLTPATADALVDCAPALIVIGIDGWSSAAYETYRVGGDRDTVYRNVQYLLERTLERAASTEVQVQFIEMDHNAHELAPFSAFWLAQGATVKVRNQLSWGGQFATARDPATAARIACPWAVTMMHVFWDGRVPRCPGDTEGTEGVGNAWHAPLAELWERLRPYRQLHLEHRFAELPARCHTCTDWMTGAAERIRPRDLPRL